MRRGRGRDAADAPAGVDGLVRSHLREVEPYVTARAEHEAAILLDANENPFGPLAPEADLELNRYPDPGSSRLRSVLAGTLGVGEERLVLTNGSDEAIDLVIRTVVEPGEPVVVATPGYGVYGVRARIHGAPVRSVSLDESFDLDVDAVESAASGAPLVVLCSPNNPTGNLLSEDRILRVLERTESVVVVDEAYVEFSGRSSLARRAGGAGPARRLAVLRTLSKAWGMAGIRVGCLVAHPEVVEYAGGVALPYPISSLAARAGLRALSRREEMEGRVERIVEERERLRRGLEALGLRVLPSDANFLLFFVGRPRRVQRRLAVEHGVVIRDRSGLPGLEGGLRVTVGTPEENRRFLDALAEVLDPPDHGRGTQ